MSERQRLVEVYFKLGFSYREILLTLAHRHGIVISERTLHRILRVINLFRRKFKSDILDVALFLMQQISVSGSLHGNRWLYATCIRNGFVVSREDIRLLLSVIDPTGVTLRTA